MLTSIGLLIVVAVVHGPRGETMGPGCDVPNPLTAAYLANLSAIPYSIETGDGDPCFWALVDNGLTIVPELLKLMEDPTMTGHRVPLFGGEYAVGDTALDLLGDIILDTPVVELLAGLESEQFKTCGYCVY